MEFFTSCPPRYAVPPSQQRSGLSASNALSAGRAFMTRMVSPSSRSLTDDILLLWVVTHLEMARRSCPCEVMAKMAMNPLFSVTSWQATYNLLIFSKIVAGEKLRFSPPLFSATSWHLPSETNSPFLKMPAMRLP